MYKKKTLLKKCNAVFNIICLISTFQICCANDSEGPLPKENMDKIKNIYEFDKWAGKVKNQNKIIEKLEIDPNIFNTIYSKKKIIRNREKQLTLKITDKKTNLDIDIDIIIFKENTEAHKNIIKYMSLSSAMPPVFKRIDPDDPNNPLNIGDVCFVPIRPWFPGNSKKPVLYSLIFCRNNTYVILRNSNDETKEIYPELEQVALIIDKKLIEISKTKN